MEDRALTPSEVRTILDALREPHDPDHADRLLAALAQHEAATRKGIEAAEKALSEYMSLLALVVWALPGHRAQVLPSAVVLAPDALRVFVSFDPSDRSVHVEAGPGVMQ